MDKALTKLADTAKIPWLWRERRRLTGEAVGLADVAGTPVSPLVRYPWTQSALFSVAGTGVGAGAAAIAGGSRKAKIVGGISGAALAALADTLVNRNAIRSMKEQAGASLAEMSPEARRRNAGKTLDVSKPSAIGWLVGQGAVSGGKLRALRASSGLSAEPTTTQGTSIAHDVARQTIMASTYLPSAVRSLFGVAALAGYKGIDVADTIGARRLWRQTAQDMV